MPDYRIWWALFVFFAIICVVVIQSRYRRWRRAGSLLLGLPADRRPEYARRLRLEGWRLLLMTLSLLAMTGVVFAVFLGVPPAVLSTLRLVALLGVLGVLLLSVRPGP